MKNDIFAVLSNARFETAKQQTKQQILSKHDLIVDYYDVYILTSVEKQNGMKIRHFIDKISESAKSLSEPGLPISGQNKYVPSINLYIRCDDKILSEKSNKILSVLYNDVLAKGIKIKLFALNGGNDKFAVAVNNMINNYQIQQIKQEFLNNQHTK